MSKFDGMTPEQRASEWRESAVLGALFSGSGLVSSLAGAALFYAGANMTFEDYKKDFAPQVVRAEIQNQMDDRIDAMRNQFLVAVKENPEGKGTVFLNAGGESLSVDRAVIDQRLKKRYERATLDDKESGVMLGVFGGAIISLSALTIRRDRKNMQAAAAKDASSHVPQ